MEMCHIELDSKTMQALLQVLGDDHWKYNTEDTLPLMYFMGVLNGAGYVWTDDGSDIYWWSTAENFYGAFSYGTGDEETMSYEEFSRTAVSPVFLSEADARNWAQDIAPRRPVFMYAHWGRGIMGPGFKWDGIGIQEIEKEPVDLKTDINDKQVEKDLQID